MQAQKAARRSHCHPKRIPTLSFYISMILEIITPTFPSPARAISETNKVIMKRLHLHISVDNLDRSIAFYSTLLGSRPSVVKPDYAKWMMEDPKVNLAISARGAQSGLDHVGIQVESDAELREIAERLKAAGETTQDQERATCCYSESNKAWTTDPSGLRWETFFTMGAVSYYGQDDVPAIEASKASCCSPVPGKKACC